MSDKINRFDDAAEAGEETASFAEKHAIGKLSITSVYFRFEAGKPSLTKAEYDAARAAGERVGTEIVFAIDIQEFSEKARAEGWKHERKCRPGTADWDKIVAPAIELLYGKGSMSRKRRDDGVRPMSETLDKLDGHYVDAVEVPQISNADYSVDKIVKIFTSREEAQAAYTARYTKREQQSGSGANDQPQVEVPPGWKSATWVGLIPTIKAELAGGAKPKDVAAGYDVPVQYVAQLM